MNKLFMLSFEDGDVNPNLFNLYVGASKLIGVN